MSFKKLFFLVAAWTTFDVGSAKAEDWPQWRGIRHDGIANSAKMPPLKFSAT